MECARGVLVETDDDPGVVYPDRLVVQVPDGRKPSRYVKLPADSIYDLCNVTPVGSREEYPTAVRPSLIPEKLVERRSRGIHRRIGTCVEGEAVRRDSGRVNVKAVSPSGVVDPDDLRLGSPQDTFSGVKL